MGLIENNNAVLLNFAGNKFSNFGVQQVVIAVYYNIGLGDLEGRGRIRKKREERLNICGVG